MGPRGRWLAQPARRNDLGDHSAEQNYHARPNRLIVTTGFACGAPPCAGKISQTVCGGGAPGPAENFSRPKIQPPASSHPANGAERSAQVLAAELSGPEPSRQSIDTAMCFPQHQSLTVPLTSPSIQLVGIVRLRLRQLVGPIRPRQPFAANAIDRCANAVGAGFLRRLGFDDLKRRSRRRVQAEHGAAALDNLCDQSSAVYVSRKGAIVKHGLQFVEPGELQSQRVLAGLLVDRGLRKAIEDLVHLGQSAGKPLGDRAHALTADTSLDNVLRHRGSRCSFRNHTTKAGPPLEVPIDAAEVTDERALQSPYLSSNSMEADVMARPPG